MHRRCVVRMPTWRLRSILDPVNELLDEDHHRNRREEDQHHDPQLPRRGPTPSGPGRDCHGAKEPEQAQERHASAQHSLAKPTPHARDRIFRELLTDLRERVAARRSLSRPNDACRVLAIFEVCRTYLVASVTVKSSKSRRNRGRQRRARACGTKSAYTNSAAIAAARALTKKLGVRFNAYKCPFCHLPSGACAWHVGHAMRLSRRLG